MNPGIHRESELHGCATDEGLRQWFLSSLLERYKPALSRAFIRPGAIHLGLSDETIVGHEFIGDVGGFLAVDVYA